MKNCLLESMYYVWCFIAFKMSVTVLLLLKIVRRSTGHAEMCQKGLSCRAYSHWPSHIIAGFQELERNVDGGVMKEEGRETGIEGEGTAKRRGRRGNARS